MPSRSAFHVGWVAAILLVGCADNYVDPPAPRELAAFSADGQSLPVIVDCPAAEQEVETWVAFSTGTLTLFGNGTFTWRFSVGRGYRTYRTGTDGSKQYLTQYSEGTAKAIEGSVTTASNGDLILDFERAATPETPLSGSGRVSGSTATMTERVECLSAPPGTAPHTFSIALR